MCQYMLCLWKVKVLELSSTSCCETLPLFVFTELIVAYKSLTLVPLTIILSADNVLVLLNVNTMVKLI